MDAQQNGTTVPRNDETRGAGTLRASDSALGDGQSPTIVPHGGVLVASNATARKVARKRRAAALADCAEVGIELIRLADRLGAGTVDHAELRDELRELSGWLLDSAQDARELRS